MYNGGKIQLYQLKFENKLNEGLTTDLAFSGVYEYKFTLEKLKEGYSIKKNAFSTLLLSGCTECETEYYKL